MSVLLHLASKPKQDIRLLEAKEKLPFLTKEADGAAAANEPPATIGKDRRILVVDDNPVVLKAFKLKLQAAGFIVSTTADGATVASEAEQANADLIILDINFSGGGGSVHWNGFTVMQWLRRFPHLAKIPVIVITGGDAAKSREKAMAAGAVAFFEKPVDFKELLGAMLPALGDIPAAVLKK
jgi:CheY-like chemotaxis protein